jgi:hypothetical protein
MIPTLIAMLVNKIPSDCRSHVTIPTLIPMDATMLYLDGNQLGVLDTPAFIGRKRVRTLFLNASSITQVPTHPLPQR